MDAAEKKRPSKGLMEMREQRFLHGFQSPGRARRLNKD
jgi:hypothetical protein